MGHMVIQENSHITRKNFFTAKMCCEKELSEGQKGRTIIAKMLGHTNTDISKVIGCSHSSVRCVWESHQLGNPSEKRAG